MARMLAMLAACACLGLPLFASAATLRVPAAGFSAQLQPLGPICCTQQFSAPGSYESISPPDAGRPGAVRNLRTTITALPQPSITSDILVTTNYAAFPTQFTNSSAGIEYAIAVAGPNSNVLVPIHMAVAWSVSATADTLQFNSARALTEFSIDTPGDVPSTFFTTRIDSSGAVSTECTGPSIGACPSGADFSGFFHFSELSGHDYHVHMGVSLSTTLGGHAHASIDPFFFIDPDFLASNPGYSLLISDGIGNAAPSSVPLPAPLWLLGSALLGCGCRRRRVA